MFNLSVYREGRTLEDKIVIHGNVSFSKHLGLEGWNTNTLSLRIDVSKKRTFLTKKTDPL